MVTDARSLTNLRRGLVEFCVLALLETEPTYGLALARRLQEDQLVAGESTLYPLLARLRSSGLVESEWRESPTGRPRKYYAITDSGRDAVATFRLSWVSLRNAVDHTLGGNS